MRARLVGPLHTFPPNLDGQQNHRHHCRRHSFRHRYHHHHWTSCWTPPYIFSETYFTIQVLPYIKLLLFCRRAPSRSLSLWFHIFKTLPFHNIKKNGNWYKTQVTEQYEVSPTLLIQYWALLSRFSLLFLIEALFPFSQVLSRQLKLAPRLTAGMSTPGSSSSSRKSYIWNIMPRGRRRRQLYQERTKNIL